MIRARMMSICPASSAAKVFGSLVASSTAKSRYASALRPVKVSASDSS